MIGTVTPAGGWPSKKTPQQKQDTCGWCRPMALANYKCECFEDCGQPYCVVGVEEFPAPEVPRFA